MASLVDDDLREQARQRLQKKRDLVGHLVTYAVINTALIGIWAFSGGGYFWPAWILLGWGVGVVLNVWDVYLRRQITEADIDREVAHLRH